MGFMRGGCMRRSICMYAHSKEELPPGFKCTICQNFTSGHCRKSQICPYAHGPEEMQWFIKFMSGPGDGTEAAGTAVVPALQQGMSAPSPAGLLAPAPAGLL